MNNRNSKILISLFISLLFVCIVVGSILYAQNCNNYFYSKCTSQKVNCELNNYTIFESTCTLNDDDIYDYDNDNYDNCYGLELQCIYITNMCYYTTGYFLTYEEALDYYQQNYYKNENLTAYIINDNNNTCSFNDPYPNGQIAVYGFYSVAFSLIIIVILFIMVSLNIIRSRQRESFIYINQLIIDPPPKYD